MLGGWREEEHEGNVSSGIRRNNSVINTSTRAYLRFMSPFMAREKMFDKLPPGQQPQMSTVTALTGSIWSVLAREKAVRGMMPNWASRAIATPFGWKRWVLILEISMVQPREIMVMKRMTTVNILMTLFREEGMLRTPMLPLPDTFPWV